MAEVTGEIGGQYVELNNAATEATLKQLLAAMLAMASAKSGGLNSKEVAELEKKLKSLREEAAKSAKQEKTKEQKQKESLATLKKVDTSLLTLGKSVLGVATGMTNLITTLSKVGNSLTAAAGTMNAIPVVGGALAGIFGAVAEAAERTASSYQAAAAAGATFGGSLTEFTNTASRAGMTIEQFGELIKSNGQGMLAFGTNTEIGAKRFSMVSKELRNTSADLMALGYSTQEINSGLARYGAQLRMQGLQGTKSNTELANGAKRYLKEMDLLAKITGEERSAKEKEREALLKDAQFQASMAGLSDDVRESFLAVTQGLPEGLRTFAKDIMAVGVSTTQENQLIMSQMPATAAMLQEFNKKMQRGEAITIEERNRLNNLMMQEAPTALKNIKFAGAASGDLSSLINALSSALGMQKDAVTASVTAQETATAQTDGQIKLIEDSKAKLADFSNTFTVFLANSGLLDDLMKSFEILANVTKEYLLPTFTFVADNFGAIVAVATPLLVVLGALKGLIMAHSVVQALQSAGIAASLVPIYSFAAGVLAAVAPLLPLIAVLGVAVYAFKKLGGDLVVIGGLFTWMGEWMKTFGSGIKWVYYKLLDLIPGIDKTAELQAAENEMKEQKARRDVIADNMSKRMAENRAKKEAENTKVTEKNTEAKKEELAITEKKNKSGPDWSNPVEVFKWYKEGGATFAGQSMSAPASAAATSFAAGAPLASGVKGILDQISKGEGTSDEAARKRGLASGYDVSLGYGAYGGGPKKAISEMSIAEVKEYQKAMLADPKNKWNSSAVGKYQIVGDTLSSLQKELGFKDTDKFDAAMQDKLGEALLRRRGMENYLSGKMTGEKFQLGLAQEWASIADPRTGRGYYGNQQTAHTSTADIQSAMGRLFMPSSTAAQTAMAKEELTPAESKGQTKVTAPATVTQESPESLLASLNTKMDQMVKYMAQTTNNTYQQVVATKGLSNDVFRAL